MQKSEQKAIQFCQYFSHFALPFPRLLRFLVQNLKGNNIGVPPSIFLGNNIAVDPNIVKKTFVRGFNHPKCPRRRAHLHNRG